MYRALGEGHISLVVPVVSISLSWLVKMTTYMWFVIIFFLAIYVWISVRYSHTHIYILINMFLTCVSQVMLFANIWNYSQRHKVHNKFRSLCTKIQTPLKSHSPSFSIILSWYPPNSHASPLFYLLSFLIWCVLASL